MQYLIETIDSQEICAEGMQNYLPCFYTIFLSSNQYCNSNIHTMIVRMPHIPDILKTMLDSLTIEFFLHPIMYFSLRRGGRLIMDVYSLHIFLAILMKFSLSIKDLSL